MWQCAVSMTKRWLTNIALLWAQLPGMVKRTMGQFYGVSWLTSLLLAINCPPNVWDYCSLTPLFLFLLHIFHQSHVHSIAYVFFYLSFLQVCNINRKSYTGDSISFSKCAELPLLIVGGHPPALLGFNKYKTHANTRSITQEPRTKVTRKGSAREETNGIIVFVRSGVNSE